MRFCNHVSEFSGGRHIRKKSKTYPKSNFGWYGPPTAEMLHKLLERDESEKEKDKDFDDETKEVEINKVTETQHDKIVVDAANDAPPTQDATTTTMEAAAEEGGDDNNVGAEDGKDDNEADNTKGRRRGGGIWRLKKATATTAKMT